MSNNPKPRFGKIDWIDLTIPEAEKVRDFYSDVVGREVVPEDMGGYEDYHMMIPGTDRAAAAGIIHCRGVNADLPPQWLIYITVEDVDECARKCEQARGKIVTGQRMMGHSRFCVIYRPSTCFRFLGSAVSPCSSAGCVPDRNSAKVPGGCTGSLPGRRIFPAGVPAGISGPFSVRKSGSVC